MTHTNYSLPAYTRTRPDAPEMTVARPAPHDELVGFITRQAAPRFRKRVKRKIAKMLSANGSMAVALEINKMVQQAQRDRELADTLLQALLAASALYTMNMQQLGFAGQEVAHGC